MQTFYNVYYRTYISAKWYGFDDPQSGLQKYEWRAGTSIGGDDIVSPTELHLTEVLALNDLSLTLPVNQKIYLTIRAYNRAGMVFHKMKNASLLTNHTCLLVNCVVWCLSNRCQSISYIHIIISFQRFRLTSDIHDMAIFVFYLQRIFNMTSQYI